MAKITTILNTKYESKEDTYPIIIKVRSGNQVRELPVGFKVRENQWNGQVIKHPDKEIINAKIADKVSEVNKYITSCIQHDREINLKSIGKNLTAASFTGYLLHRAKGYQAANQPTMEGRLLHAHKELTENFGDIAFLEITVDLIREYQAYLKKKNHANTIHKRLSMLRQLFTNAVNEGVYIGANPFVLVKAKQEPVNKEKLTVQEIQDIEDADLMTGPDLARDIFLFSYYAKGMRFENCIYLQWKDIRDGRIYITTNKGRKHISIEIHKKLKVILDKYKGQGFVFPLIKEMPTDRRRTTDGVNMIVNRDLKIVAAAAGIKKNLTMHLARHSIAFHLKQKGVPVGAIKDILGHSDTATTERYLKAMDDEILDHEMDKVYK